MKRIITATLFSIALLFFASPAAAQTERFSDANVEYTFDVPDAKWKMTVKPSATSPNVEYVFVDRNDGHMEVRKVSSPANTPMSEVMREEEQRLQFLPGYVAGREENFNGRLRGNVFNFEFVRSGRPMAGRYYYLRSGDSVYILRFSGYRDKLRSIRTQTDIIARTFAVN